MDGPSPGGSRVLGSLLGPALAFSCWIIRRSWAGGVGSSERSRDGQGNRTVKLQAVAPYQSVQNKLFWCQ